MAPRLLGFFSFCPEELANFHGLVGPSGRKRNIAVKHPVYLQTVYKVLFPLDRVVVLIRQLLCSVTGSYSLLRVWSGQ